LIENKHGTRYNKITSPILSGSLKVILFMLVGRENEYRILENLNSSDKAQFVAVYGRRRVGKTYLIESFFKERAQINFQITGEKKGSKKRQLEIFRIELENAFYNRTRIPNFSSWNEAFTLLIACLKALPKTTSVLLFLDELPWLAGERSGLLEALDHAWNSELRKIPFVRLVICGSSASWIIKKIVQNKGGLHNRLTEQIHLKPFTLHETKKFLHSQEIHYNQNQIIEIYMALGGIPYYLSLIHKGESATQAISRLCFGGSLTKEFDLLFDALFDNATQHKKIVSAIENSRKGISRTELLKKLKLTAGGRLTEWLNELLYAGFIEKAPSIYAKTSETRYRVIDQFSLFHLKWIRNAPTGVFQPKENYWNNIKSSSSYSAWSGYAFENLCYTHLEDIRKALGINNIKIQVGHWSYHEKNNPNKKGAEIDLVLDRDDDVISLCEIKFHDKKITFSKELSEKINYKRKIFLEKTRTRKTALNVLICKNGVIENEYIKSTIQNIVNFEKLF
jgi:predicted AAA+ superfamily ATPase